MRQLKAPLATLAAAAMAIGCTAASQPGSAPAGRSTAVTRSTAAIRTAVPWHQVGPGWVLIQDTDAMAPEGMPPEGGQPGPETLDLISPDGTSHRIASWPDSATAPSLRFWSPDGARALFQAGTGSNVTYEQMTLATGAVSPVRLPSQWNPVGYTTPDGLNIVAVLPENGAATELARFDLAGHLVRRLGSATFSVLYTADGTALVTGAPDGVKLVSNTGTLVRQLPVPGASRSCDPVRWWTASTVLVSCTYSSSRGDQWWLWLVPASGQLPTALTPRPGPDTPNAFDAWQLSSGQYVQSDGASDVSIIYRQAPDGSVDIPQTGGDPYVLTANGSSLLITAWTGSGLWSDSLLWVNPATGAERWLVKTPSNTQGVTAAIPFNSSQNALPRPGVRLAPCRAWRPHLQLPVSPRPAPAKARIPKRGQFW